MNSLYLAYKNVIEGSGIYAVPDWDTDTFGAVICTAAYTASVTTDIYLSDIPSGARISTAALSGLSISAGSVLASATVTFSAVPAGAALTQLALYKNTGTATTSPLLIYFDTFGSGMPRTPTGRDIVLNFDAAGIFNL